MAVVAAAGPCGAAAAPATAQQPSPLAALPPSPFSSEAAALPAKPETPPTDPDRAAADIFSVGVAAAAVAAAGFEAQLECVKEGAESGYGIAAGDNIVPHGEEDRLKALRMLGVVQQPVGHQFGSITSLLKLIFDVPVSQAFLIDEESSYGVPNSPQEPWVGYPRSASHCRYIFDPSQHEMLIIEDLTQDIRFRDNPWVKQPPHFRFYAAAPLVSTDGGHRYGTLCVIDFKPRHFSAQQYQMLSHLAEVAVRELESACLLHWSQMQFDEAQRNVRRLVRSLDCFSEGILLCDVEGGWEVRYANSAFSRLTGLGRQQAVGAALWSLFGLPAGGATAADVLAALRGRQPFTFSIGLLPEGSTPGPGKTPVQLTPASSTDVEPPSSPVGSTLIPAPTSPTSPPGSTRQLENGGLFTATFTPASSPEFRPDEPAISIPIVPAPPGYGSGDRSSGRGGGGLEERLWFVTLQRPAGPGRGGSLSLSTQGSMPAEASPAGPVVNVLRPLNMADVQLGPLLGVGASGRAYRGSWHGTDVCVKILNLFAPLSPTGSTNSDAGFPTAPLLEAALSKALLHPNIVPTHAWGVSEGEINAQGQHHSQVWIVQSLCTLGTLAHARDRGLFQDPATQGPDLRTILLTMRDVAAALSYLHSVGVVHGDLSGNNVLLSPSSPDERGFTAMVADFGLARPQGLSPDAVPRGSFGTVPNMPPELLSDDVLVPAADSWAFGTLLWELLSGRRAWRGMGPMQIIAAVTLEHRSLCIPHHWPPGLQDLLRACLDHDPEKRPTAQQMLDTVQVLLDAGAAMPAEVGSAPVGDS